MIFANRDDAVANRRTRRRRNAMVSNKIFVNSPSASRTASSVLVNRENDHKDGRRDSSNENKKNKMKRITESVWRNDARHHQTFILQQFRDALNSNNSQQQHVSSSSLSLDPNHPIYNFFIEYYGVKGSKGFRKLLRWSPSIYEYYYDNITTARTILHMTNSSKTDVHHVDAISYPDGLLHNNHLENSDIPQDNIYDSILLEGAKEDDFIDLLHSKGVVSMNDDGIIYNPSLYYQRRKQYSNNNPTDHTSHTLDNNNYNTNNVSSDEGMIKTVSSLLWYRSILEATVRNEPILHCYGLHEWAMQYYPYHASTKPYSQKYQQHLSYRVSRDVINHVVETNGIHCTHMDAMRFFTPEAYSYNQYGHIETLRRQIDQIRLEQPACLHAQMDLFKYCYKLQPFYDTILFQKIIHHAIECRTLDIRASPYDVTTTYGLSPIHVEKVDGKKVYRDLQIQYVTKSQPLRFELLHMYDLFIHMTFPSDIIQRATKYYNPKTQQQQQQ